MMVDFRNFMSIYVYIKNIYYETEIIFALHSF